MFGSKDMKIRSILYIGMALLMAGCQSDDRINNTLWGGEKSPLLLEPSLTAQRALTRAAADQFADDDQLLVYIRHTTGGEKGNYTTVAADQAPKLVTFNAKVSPVLYWDDFSNSIAETTDLRTEGHALQTYYGYCYNGGTPTTALEETTGKLGWTIGNQTTAADVQHADLLWSTEQFAVAYNHTSRGALEVPFTHAMSEVTVTITTDDTFGDSPLTRTTLTLNSMNTVAEVNAPAGTITSSDAKVITMCGADDTSGKSRTFTAIVAPGTTLKVGEKLLDITDVEGNNYTLTITDEMIATDAWAKNHTVNDYAITTQSGVNYHLAVNVSKTAVAVQATLKDWTTVNANGTGDIAFNDDIVNVSVDGAGTAFNEGASFRLYWKKTTSDSYAEATTSTLTNGEWVNAPAIYWPNGTDSYYFRALSGIENTTVAQQQDVLWGTTAKHNNIEAGAAIAPRTGDVPMIFEHAMAKIQFKLETTAGDAAVDLTDATIAVDSIYTSGTIHIEDGNITTAAPTTDVAIASLAPNTDAIVIPQTISNKAVVIITLKDGTKYKLQLNQCMDGSQNAIAEWERGKRYVYTIHLEKEQMKFRAVIKAWDEKQGSGDATLDWD